MSWTVATIKPRHRNFVIVRKARKFVYAQEYADHWKSHREVGGHQRYRQLPLSGATMDMYRYWEALLRKHNDAQWRFNLSHWNQPIHIGEYQPGDVFPVHTDYNEDDASKLAFVQLLPGRFAGGRLYIAGKHVHLLPGDAVIFPAYMPHEVRTVTSGTRYALAGWASGPRFV